MRKALFVPVFIIAMLAMFGMANATNTSFPLIGTVTGTSITSTAGNTVSNTIIDVGQLTVITINYEGLLSGGTPPYSANFLFAGPNSISGNTITINGIATGNYITLVANWLTQNSLTLWISQNSLTPTPLSVSASGTNTIYGTWTFNAVISDGTNTLTTTSIPPVTVDPAPTANTLLPSNTVLDSGQYVTYNVVINGGTLPITANLVLVSNTMPLQINGANAVPGTTYNTIVLSGSGSPVSNIITFNSLELTASSNGIVTFNVIAVDSASTPVTFNSVTNAITVNPAPYITLTVTPANSLMYGKAFTVNSVINGGTGNFAVYWFVNGNALPSNSITVISANTQTSNTMTLAANGIYNYIVEANDIGTSSVYSMEAANTVLIYINNTLAASLTGNPGTAYYQQPVAITFTGTPTINNQSPWELYVNGALYGKTASKITWSENDANVGTYSFLFENPGNNNYTSKSISTSLSIIYMPSGVSGVSTTTVPTTTVTTTTPTTTVVPVTTVSITGSSGSISKVVSATSPLAVNFANEQATIYVSTPSSAPAPVTVYVANATSTAPKPPANYTLVKALNLSIKTNVSVSANVSMTYPCSMPASSVAPFVYENGTWVQITHYSVNPATCAISFAVPSDPLVGILSKTVTTTTTVPTTSVPTTSTVPTTTVLPTPPLPPTPPNHTGLIIAIIVVVVIIIVIAAYYSSKSKHRRH